MQPATYNGDLLTQSGAVYDASEIDKTTEKLTLDVAEKGYRLCARSAAPHS